MPADREDRTGRQSVRRSVVPEAAGRSLWLSAVWTGVGAAVGCATLALVAVALCWLPVSGSGSADGHRASSTIKAGLLSFLAALHGGITLDGSQAAWLPLGMLLIVAVILWRAGTGLGDAATALDERDPARLWLAGSAQAASFAACCVVAVPFASLGTSRAPFLGVGAAALLLFAASGLVAFVRSSPLRQWCAERIPDLAVRAARGAAAAVAVYLCAGALLVAVALTVHHREVSTISHQVGGGWGGVPVLLLGMLAAPNAAIAGASYVAGPGFAVGAGTTVRITSAAHGTMPAFPLLGAVPSGSGATQPVWALVITTPLLAAMAVARLAARTPGWRARLGTAACAAPAAGVIMLGLAWQGGGAVGNGRLHTVGASPWQFAVATAVEVGVLSLAWLGLGAAWTWLRQPVDDEDEVGFFLTPKSSLVVVPDDAEKPDEADQLAG